MSEKEKKVDIKKEEKNDKMSIIDNTLKNFSNGINDSNRSESKEDNQEKEAEVYRKVLLLNGLDCANCANKIERLAQRTFNHEFINVDFATCRFVIVTKDKDLIDHLIERVEEVARKVDSNIVVTDKEIKKEKEVEEEEEDGVNKITFLIGTILFVILVVLHYLVFNLVFDDYHLYLSNINEAPAYLKYPLIAIALASYILLGGDILLGAINNIRHGRFFDEKFLMSIATVVAFAIHSYVEAIAVMAFYKIGELLQERVVAKSRRNISELIDIKPNSAIVIINNNEIVVDPSELAVGDTIVVRPGERIPVDGIVLSGEASLDTSAITGESKYYDVKEGSKVISGTINIDGVLNIKVEKKYNDSMVSKILDLVENANSNKAKTEKFVTKFAKYYTPIVCGLAVLIAVYFLIFGERNIHDALYPAMVFLVVSCPCALIISVPLTYFAAIGVASKKGILIKGSNYLDEVACASVIAFDKTGTLTSGKFKVKEVVSLNEQYNSDDILRIAAHCEAISNHPIAKSIVNKYGANNVSINDVEAIDINKRGVSAKYENNKFYVGNNNYIFEKHVKVKEVESEGIIIYIALDHKVIGYIELTDEIRDASLNTLNNLKLLGYKIAMLTGDNENVARNVANELKIDNYYHSLTPVEKVKKIRKIKKENNKNKVIFVGDGVNDAPVLNNADIGIAMGEFGTDAAIEVSDIVLMHDDLNKLPELFLISRRTRCIVFENIIFALLIKFIVLIGAAIDKSGIIKMWEGVFADVGVSLIATLNALRVIGFNYNKQLIRLKRRHK